MKILTVFGTRPEAIKLAPVLRQLNERSSAVQSVVCVTGQHRQMLDQILSLFDIKPHYDLNIMRDGQDLFDISINTLAGLKGILAKEKPDIVLVQGDTSSAFFATLAAFYRQVPVAHVEAGLRTFDKYDPFPEEANRTLIGNLAEYHFAPTTKARDNLLRAGVLPSKIHLTGNTIVDAAQMILAKPAPPLPGVVSKRDSKQHRLLVMTSHRRESFGAPMRRLFAAVRDLLRRNSDLVVVFPVHLNPMVHSAVTGILAKHERLVLLPPLPYDAFIHLLKRSYLIVTDSGGVQEEASILGKPVVVVRETTERSESVWAGISVVAGRDRRSVVEAVERLLRDRTLYRTMKAVRCPYGDGKAARRIVEVLAGPVRKQKAAAHWRNQLSKAIG